MNQILIRPYQSKDRAAVRKIACDTAFMGESAEKFFEGRELLADFLTLYFTDYEPESCFVAESEGQVIGYLLGARNESAIISNFALKIIPVLLVKLIFGGAFLIGKNRKFLIKCCWSFLKGEFRTPSFKDYPATLHINLDPTFRSAGIGTRLIKTYLDYLKETGVKGVHLATTSEDALGFFEKQGFLLVYRNKRSCFRHILEKDLICYYLVREI